MGGPAAEITLRVEVDGLPPATWTRDDIDKAPRIQLPLEEDHQRDAWSLRDVARKLVGPDAAVTEVIGGGGRTVTIDAAAWRDLTRTPALRANRRGLLKFEWLDEKLQPIEGDKIRAVTTLRVTRRLPSPGPAPSL